MELTKEIYVVTQQYPMEEKYGLTSQIRRSAVSVPSNIAEGAGRNGSKKFNNFLGIAMGSLFELDTQVELSYDLKYVQAETYKGILDKITQLRKMIFLFQKKLTT